MLSSYDNNLYFTVQKIEFSPWDMWYLCDSFLLSGHLACLASSLYCTNTKHSFTHSLLMYGTRVFTLCINGQKFLNLCEVQLILW